MLQGQNNTTAAATDVGVFINDVDGGQFERKLSIALSQVAAASVDHSRVGKVSIEFKICQIPGTNQVRVEHRLEFTKPTMDGTVNEKETRATVMHVGQFGALTLAQPSLLPAGIQGEIRQDT